MLPSNSSQLITRKPMPKNRLSQLNTKKEESERAGEHIAEDEARAAMEGTPAWDDETRDARVSMRVEPSLKEAFEERLPKFVSITDAIREYMLRVATQEQDPV